MKRLGTQEGFRIFGIHEIPVISWKLGTDEIVSKKGIHQISLVGYSIILLRKMPTKSLQVLWAFFIKSPEVPNRAYMPSNLWIPNLLSDACVHNCRDTVDSILKKQDCYAQPIT